MTEKSTYELRVTTYIQVQTRVFFLGEVRPFAPVLIIYLLLFLTSYCFSTDDYLKESVKTITEIERAVCFFSFKERK